jgi:hypothetical protein
MGQAAEVRKLPVLPVEERMEDVRGPVIVEQEGKCKPGVRFSMLGTTGPPCRQRGVSLGSW